MVFSPETIRVYIALGGKTPVRIVTSEGSNFTGMSKNLSGIIAGQVFALCIRNGESLGRIMMHIPFYRAG